MKTINCAIFAFLCALVLVGAALEPEREANELRAMAPTMDYRPVPGGWLLSFDGSRRCPRWTLERLTKDSFGYAERAPNFHNDPYVPKEFASSSDDYNGFTTKYDRGHMAASDNHTKTQAINRETFTIANTAPQVKVVNEQLLRLLEAHVRTLVTEDNVVWVLTVSVWAPDQYPASWADRDAKFTAESIGLNHVQVPTHFVKSVLVVDKNGDVESMNTWLFPNDETVHGKAFDDYKVEADSAEAVTGLDFWRGVPKKLQDDLESRI